MYSLDYIQKLIELLSPDKRSDSIIAWNKPAFLDIQNLHDNLFKTYKEFQSLPQWISGTYSRNTKVIYNKAVYQSLINSNTDQPTFTNSWELISTNFLGSDMRLAVRGEKLLFEYAINTWFGTTFRQPNSLSDIYVFNNPSVSQSPFKAGYSESKSSLISPVESFDFVGLDYLFFDSFGFSIMIPSAVFIALGSSTLESENIVRDFADKYVPCGIKYKVSTY